MLYLGGWFILGAVLGALLARGRGGRGIDALHYGAVFGIILTLVGLFVGIIIGHYQ